MIALITGGSGCGKSTWAEKLTRKIARGDRYYIATMTVPDAESAERVRRHRAQRADMGFQTLEMPKAVDVSKVLEGSTVLFEDLPNLIANEMFEEGGDIRRALPAITALMDKCAHLIIVTNDVFSDGVSYDPATDRYIRALAELNSAAAARADLVCELVYSIPVAIKGELPIV